MIVDALQVKYYIKVVAVCQSKEVPLFGFSVENHALRLCLNVNGAENRVELINSSNGFSFGIDHDLLRIKGKRYMG